MANSSSLQVRQRSPARMAPAVPKRSALPVQPCSACSAATQAIAIGRATRSSSLRSTGAVAGSGQGGGRVSCLPGVYALWRLRPPHRRQVLGEQHAAKPLQAQASRKAAQIGCLEILIWAPAYEWGSERIRPRQPHRSARSTWLLNRFRFPRRGTTSLRAGFFATVVPPVGPRPERSGNRTIRTDNDAMYGYSGRSSKRLTCSSCSARARSSSSARSRKSFSSGSCARTTNPSER